MLKRRDIEITHLKGSGPGGQNRNKRLTGVRVHHYPSGLTVTATERRSQAQNLAAALERLEEKIRRSLHRDRPRVATRPSRPAVERRLTNKLQRAKTKGDRKKWGDE